MRLALATGLFVAYGSIFLTAQISPASYGSCSVSPSGLMGCNWISAKPTGKPKGAVSKLPSPSNHPAPYVTRFLLAPGALLERTVQGYDVLIIAMGSGQLANEKKSPAVSESVNNGWVVLMTKEEDYQLRNVGAQELDLLVVHTRP